MIGKNLGLCAAALALPFSVLVPAAATAATAPASTATSATTVASDSTAAATNAKSPRVKVWDYEYNEDDDYFDIEVKYQCHKKGNKKNGTVYGWVYQEHVDTYYWGKAKARCDGKWHYKWIEADRYDHDDDFDEDYITVGGGVEDPRGNYKYHEVEKYFSY